MSAVCVMKEIKPDKIADPAGTGKKVRLRTKISYKEITFVCYFLAPENNL